MVWEMQGPAPRVFRVWSEHMQWLQLKEGRLWSTSQPIRIRMILDRAASPASPHSTTGLGDNQGLRGHGNRWQTASAREACARSNASQAGNWPLKPHPLASLALVLGVQRLSTTGENTFPSLHSAVLISS